MKIMMKKVESVRPVGLLFLMAGLSMLLSGCASITRDFGTPVPSVGHFSDGQTYYGEVLKELGPPAKISRLDAGMVFLYEHAILLERQVGVDIKYQETPILKLVLAHGKVNGETAALVFDDEGILMSHAGEEWKRSLGWATSVQLFISVMSMTDTGGYDAPIAAHEWGMELLKYRLPESLNRDSSLSTGRNGLERKGTPQGCGQSSLELVPFAAKR
jgi:hypothetical protein